MNPFTSTYSYVYFDPTGVNNPLGVIKTALATLTPTQDLDKVLKNLQGKNGGLTLGDKKLEAIYHPSFTLDFGKPRLGK